MTDPYEIYNKVMDVLEQHFIDPSYMLRNAGQIQFDIDELNFWEAADPEFCGSWPEFSR